MYTDSFDESVQKTLKTGKVSTIQHILNELEVSLEASNIIDIEENFKEATDIILCMTLGRMISPEVCAERIERMAQVKQRRKTEQKQIYTCGCEMRNEVR